MSNSLRRYEYDTPAYLDYAIDRTESFMERFEDGLDIEINPEYEYDELEDFDGNHASHRHLKIGGHFSFKGKRRK